MKILWLTNTPGTAAVEFGYPKFAGGWISSLQQLMAEDGRIKLALCFFYDGEREKRAEIDNVQYFGIPLKNRSGLSRIYNRHLGKPDDENRAAICSVMEAFKPDLIHVFGTERGFGKIIPEDFKNVLFHIQGLVSPIKEAYYASGISKMESLTSGGFRGCLRGLSFFHQYLELHTRAEREIEIIKKWRFFSGRTEWDRNNILLQNPAAQYFHCDEMLRPAFFENEKKTSPTPSSKTFVISSTINPNLYKGLDVVYRTIPLLKDIPLVWKIFGVSATDRYNTLIMKSLKVAEKPHQIEFMGPTQENRLVAEIINSDLFVHPSHIDNSPNSVCEAMMLGLPVLSSGVGGVPSIIKHGVTGYLFNPYDRFDLAGWINHIRTNYDETLQTGRNAREVALKRHDPEKIRKTLLEIYSEIIRQ